MEETMEKEFTHIDEEGAVRMVDVTDKAVTDRRAVAEGRIFMNADTFLRITDEKVKKGNVLETARIAGVMAAKKTAETIPMCHPLFLTYARIDFFPEPENHAFRIEGEVRVKGETGVEMEALHAVSVAGLTIYDMCKAYDKGMTLEGIRLMAKSGGKSGDFKREGV